MAVPADKPASRLNVTTGFCARRRLRRSATPLATRTLQCISLTMASRSIRLLIAMICVCLMIGLAVPANGDPGGEDAGFLTALRQAGITYSNPAQAIGAAQAVCTCLDEGESGLEVVHDVKSHNPGFDMEDASRFALISAEYYCRQQLSKA